jgi:glycogen debranching enzyme
LSSQKDFSDLKSYFADKEKIRSEFFEKVWNKNIPDVFADCARYYDNANDYASLF